MRRTFLSSLCLSFALILAALSISCHEESNGSSGLDAGEKARLLKRLRENNLPPVAVIEILGVFPRRVDVVATKSMDPDGFVSIYYFRLEDLDTGEVLAGPITTREPHAALITNVDLPPNIAAIVTVEDDTQAIDTAMAPVAVPPGPNCSTSLFSCTVQSNGGTVCKLIDNGQNALFTTSDLLDAAQGCDSTIDNTTPLLIGAAGGSGGRGADIWPSNGGSGGCGGIAVMATTTSDLDSQFGDAMLYIWHRSGRWT